MRLFVAFGIPAPARREIAARGERLRGELPPARWVAAENLHLTLVFLGEVGEAERTALETALEPVFARHPPPRLRLVGAGCFPPAGPGRRPRPVRVAWVGVEALSGLAGLRRLQAEVAAVCAAAAGVEPDSRPYTPHLTVAWPREPWDRAAAEHLAQGFAAPIGEPFAADEAALVCSELGRGPGGGALHRPIARFPLGGAADAAGIPTAAAAGGGV